MILTTRGLWDTISTRTDADFLVQPGRRFRFGDLERAVRQWLAAFDAHGIVPGKRIVIHTRRDEGSIAAFLAAILDGVVPVILSADMPTARVRSLCDTIAPALLVVDDDHDPRVARADAALIALCGQGAPAVRSLPWRRPKAAMLPQFGCAPADRAPRLPMDADGLAYILFTSGTTASPSGVSLSRGNLFANLATISRVFDHDASSRLFNDMALAHADGLVQGPLLAAANGCALIRSDGFQLGGMEAWLGRVRSTRATHVITVPTIWAMIDAYARHDDYFDAPECRALLSVAARLQDALWCRLESRFQRPVFSQYGLTETVTSALYAGPHPEMGALGTAGRPIDCAARIDPAAADEGELQLRGDNVFAGYWNDAARTAASFTEDRWFRTGDMARRQEDGSYLVLGRLKSAIMSGGLLIRPDEIDEAMLLHPLVAESATVGMADAMFGEVPMTAIVCRGRVDENALTAHARAHLEPHKIPRRILVVAAIPRGDAGKANLAAVRSVIGDAMAQPAVSATAGGDVQQAVLAAAAGVFRTDAASLSLRMGQDDVAGWDSFSQLTLLLAVEEALDMRIPASRVAAIETLGDIVRTVEGLRR